MRMSHTCAGCGYDLTPLRALPDPHYRLPIVVCPSCDTATVRRRPWTRGFGRRLRALVRAVHALVRVIGVLALLTGAFYAATRFASDDVRLAFAASARERALFTRDAVLFDAAWKDALLGVSAASAFAGAWVATISVHWGRRPIVGALRGAGAWGACIALLILLPPIVWLVGGPLGRAIGANWQYAGPSKAEYSWHLLTAAGAMLIVIGLGVPLGLLFNASAEARRSRRWRKALGKSRALRAQTC